MTAFQMLTVAVSAKLIYPLNSPPSLLLLPHHPTLSPVVCYGLSGFVQMVPPRPKKKAPSDPTMGEDNGTMLTRVQLPLLLLT